MSSPYELLGLPKNALADFFRDHKSPVTQLAPSDEPLSWKSKGTLVRLDVAIMAAHLFAARVHGGKLLSIVDIALAKVESTVGSWLSNRLFLGLLGLLRVPLKFAQQIAAIADLIRQDEAQAAKEKAIRDASITAMRDVWNSRLFARRKGQRRTKRVLTRHYQPRQRKPNKKWQSPT
jgi:hypothetical protein